MRGALPEYRTDVIRQTISFPAGEVRYTRSSSLNRSGKSVIGWTFTSPLTPHGLSALPIVISIGRPPAATNNLQLVTGNPAEAGFLLRLCKLFHDPRLGEQGLHCIGRDRALLEPVDGLCLIHLDRRRLLERVVGPDHFNEATVSRGPGVRHHQPV